MPAPPPLPTPLTILACSGLGHVRRGNESWAHTVAEALHSHQIPVLLASGAPLASHCPSTHLSCLQRDSPWLRLFPWHHRYFIEQRTFARSLLRFLQRNSSPNTIVHLTDPLLSELVRRHEQRLNIDVLYKDGQLLGPEWCQRFRWVQALAPNYRDDAQRAGLDISHWFTIPHLVDTQRFQPAPNRAQARALSPGGPLPPNVPIVLAVGDFSPGSQKRLESVVTELAQLHNPAPHLVLAGQATAPDIERFRQLGAQALPGRLHLRPNLPPDQMHQLYPAADLFLHAATREPFGIVFLEAMASGLPILAHHWITTAWIVDNAGEVFDTTPLGAIAQRVETFLRVPSKRAEFAQRARARAQDHFSVPIITEKYRAAYNTIRASARDLA